jgi:serine/threonine-protein kinase
MRESATRRELGRETRVPGIRLASATSEPQADRMEEPNPDLAGLGLRNAFAVFAEQDSGCLSYGVVDRGRRWFVKRAMTDAARLSLARAVAFHAAVRHQAIVAPHRVLGTPTEPVIVYPWYDGTVLNHATRRGTDRTGLARFQTLPMDAVLTALTEVIDAHVAVAAAGMVAVDLYDGCLLYDFAARRVRLIDLDEYRPGPFALDADRLPGSRRYMAPEEFVRGAIIDQRTTIFTLGRMIWHLLDSTAGWRGGTGHSMVITRATHPDKANRFATVSELAGAWLDEQ